MVREPLGPQVPTCTQTLLRDTNDAFVLLEAVRRGILPRVYRRLTREEREAHIKDGVIFVFEEGETQMQRWTDGLKWSASRVTGEFLAYDQLASRPEFGAGPSSGDRWLVKQTFASSITVDGSTRKYHLIAYHDGLNPPDRYTRPSLSPRWAKLDVGMWQRQAVSSTSASRSRSSTVSRRSTRPVTPGEGSGSSRSDRGSGSSSRVNYESSAARESSFQGYSDAAPPSPHARARHHSRPRSMDHGEDTDLARPSSFASTSSSSSDGHRSFSSDCHYPYARPPPMERRSPLPISGSMAFLSHGIPSDHAFGPPHFSPTLPPPPVLDRSSLSPSSRPFVHRSFSSTSLPAMASNARSTMSTISSPSIATPSPRVVSSNISVGHVSSGSGNPSHSSHHNPRPTAPLSDVDLRMLERLGVNL